MAEFTNDENDLYIDGKKVIKAWESFSGWFWFAIELAGENIPYNINGKKVIGNEYFGFVQGLEEEYGYFADAELKLLMSSGKVWEIKKPNLLIAGRR